MYIAFGSFRKLKNNLQNTYYVSTNVQFIVGNQRAIFIASADEDMIDISTSGNGSQERPPPLGDDEDGISHC